MLGHLRPIFSDPELTRNYRLSYCSLCAGIRSERNALYALSVNHELTFVLTLLEPFLEGKKDSATRCPATAFTKSKLAYDHPILKKAGRLALALAEIKVTDKIADEPNVLYKGAKAVFFGKNNKAQAYFSESFVNLLGEYRKMVTSDEYYEKELLLSGKLSSAVFRELALEANVPEDTRQKLSDLFFVLGRLISLSDHLCDLEADLRKKRDNPILKSPENISDAYYHFRHRFAEELIRAKNLMKVLNFGSEEHPVLISSALNRLIKAVRDSQPAFIEVRETTAANTPEEVIMLSGFDCDGDCDCCDSCDGCDGCCGGSSSKKEEAAGGTLCCLCAADDASKVHKAKKKAEEEEEESGEEGDDD